MDLLGAMKTEFAKAIAVYKTKLSQVDLPIDDIKAKAEELKKTKPEIGEKLEKAADNAKEAGKKAIEDAMAEGSEYLENIKKEFGDIGINVGELSTTTVQFPTRVAMVPPAMIVTTPTGPGLSPQLSLPMIQQLKAEGDALGTSYDKVATSFAKLGVDLPPGFTIPEFGSITIPGINFDPEALYEQSADSLKSLIDSGVKTLMAPVLTPIGTIASVMIKLVGGSCGGESGETPTVDPPMEPQEYSAKNCASFSYIIPPEHPEFGQEGDISAGNCSNFEAMTVKEEFEYDENGLPVIDEDGNPVSHPLPVTPDCNNCKKYKQKV